MLENKILRFNKDPFKNGDSGGETNYILWESLSVNPKFLLKKYILNRQFVLLKDMRQ